MKFGSVVTWRLGKERIDEGYGVNKTGEAVFLDFSSAIERYGRQEAAIARISNPSNEEIIALGEKVVEAKYGNCSNV